MLSFNTPVMFTQKEKARESRSLCFTYLATVFIELSQLDIKWWIICVKVHNAFRIFPTTVFFCRYITARLTEMKWKGKISHIMGKKLMLGHMFI
jgi:hypothetical protein